MTKMISKLDEEDIDDDILGLIMDSDDTGIVDNVEDDLEIEEPEETPDEDVDEDRWIPKWKRSNCPKSDSGHHAIKDKIALQFGRVEFVCEHCGKKDWTPAELEFIADQILKEDSNAELCRECMRKNKTPDVLPYGKETSHVEWQLRMDANGDPVLDEYGDAIYIGFPEYVCDNGHRWYKGEGTRRNINGKNPILFDSHIYNRKRREIYAADGVPDPAFTMDRWGKRPIVGMYNRCVDDQTQALTPAGWKHYDELSKGQLIWSYDIHTDACDWQPLEEDPFVNDNFAGWLQALESENISARVTEGHRWPVVHESDKSHRYEVVRLQEEHLLLLAHYEEHNDKYVTGGDLLEPVRGALKDNEYYEGVVWCPTVASGFWLAKRNNKVYVTGNTHPEGRKTNSPSQRARGTGYYR